MFLSAACFCLYFFHILINAFSLKKFLKNDTLYCRVDRRMHLSCKLYADNINMRGTRHE